MRLTFVLPLTLGVVLAGTAGAQRVRINPAPDVQPRIFQYDRDFFNDEPRAALGVSTGGSASARDTLGLLVTSIMSNSPAEKAGLEEGNRLASVNGVNLKVSPADVGDWEVTNAMSHRLTRELGKLKPGDEVELRVYSGGQTRSLRVKTVDSDSLYRRRRFSRNDFDDRATLGFGVGTTGSRRDTLGVLVMYVNDSGPAARAGMEEGNRVAAINGVDLRVSREDSGDDYIANAKVRRLMREIGELKPGDDVELRVYGNGQFRTLKIKAARASDLPRKRGGFMMSGEGMTIMAPTIQSFPRIGFDGAVIGDEVRRAVERAMDGAGRAIEGVGRGLGGVRWRSDWHDEDIDRELESERARRLQHIDPSGGEPEAGTRMKAPARVRMPFRSAALPEDEAVWTVPVIARSAEPIARAEWAAGDATAEVNVRGLRLVPVGDELASYFGEGSERGALVVEAPDWASALRAGDVLLRVNGHAVRTGSNLENILLDLDRSRATTVELLRGGERRSVTIPASR